jgi:hypothetical protein
MSIDVSGKNLLQERMLKEYELHGQQYIKPTVPLQQNIPNPIYTKPLQYLDSPFFNSHLYPNFKPIRPYETGYMPVSKGAYIDDSIKNTTQVVGGKIYTVADAASIVTYQ